jgi:hypothetical protein
MQIFNELNDDNFMMYAMRNYYNPRCIDIEEFHEDINRFKYIKRLLNRYIETGKLSERLVLNHLIVIFNSFDIQPTLKMLEYKLDEKHWPVIKPFVLFLGHIKANDYVDIQMDKNVVDALRKI